MQRYLLSPEQIKEGKVTFWEEEVHHLLHVMRYREGDRVIVGDGERMAYLVEIGLLTPKTGEGKVLYPIIEERELPVQVTLAQGIAKGEKMDLIIQKATELGVYAVLPFFSERTIVKLEGKKEADRRRRWQKIAKEAAEQSHRITIPAIFPSLSFAQLLASVHRFEYAFIPYEKELERSFFSHVETIPSGKSVLIIIGPEGGFTEGEIAAAEREGVIPVSLGRRILRTETAGLVALSAFVHHHEGRGGGSSR